MIDTQRGKGAAAGLVVAAVLCWAVAAFGLFQLALIAGNEAVEAAFGEAAGTPAGVYVAGVVGSLALAFGFVICTVMAGRRSRVAARTSYLLAGGGLAALGIMLGAMSLQQQSLIRTMADAADVSVTTSFAEGLIGVAAVLLLVGAVATGLTGLLRRAGD